MRQKLFALAAISFLLCIHVHAQKYYYSRNTKVLLSEDTTTIIIKGKQKASYNRIATLLHDKFILFDTTALKDLALIKFNTPVIKYQNLNLIKADTGILYISNLLKGGNVPYIPTGQILLLPKEGTNVSALLSSLSLANKIQSTGKAYDITVLKIVEGEDVFAIANKIYESGQVKWCHPNFFVPIEHFTNDPLYAQQFYLKNTGQGGGTPGIDINVEPAWNITKGSSSIKIAVIDDGVEDHEDLSGRVLNGYTPRDINGNGRPTSSGAHGEACAGIIAATQDNNIGIAGIAPNCMIVPVNIFYGGETTLDIANAINWAWNQGQADVLSNSWGYNTSSQTQTGFDAIIQAINNARTQGRNGKGSVVVFASGNGSTSVSFPANVQDVITVGAIQKTGTLWGYSNTGPEMDVVTVSGNTNLLGDITTTDRMGSLGYEGGNYTARFGGTSAACPQVSGVAALILSANSNLTEQQVRNLIQSTATDMGAPGFDNSFGYGRVNADAAVCQAISTGFVITSNNGDNAVCSSASYTVNAPSGASVVWSIDATAIASINPTTGNTTTLTKIADGRITLTANISGGCLGGGAVITKKIGVGIPDLAKRFPRQNPRIAPVQYGYYNYATQYQILTDPMPGSYQTWTVSTDDPYFSWGFSQNNKLGFFFSNSGYQAIFYGTETNACGSSYGYIYCKSVVSGGSGGGVPLLSAPDQFAFSPNPTTGIAQVISINKTSFKQINIFDKIGNLKYQLNYPQNTNSATINVSRLKPDIYAIQVVFDNSTVSKQFIKQ